MPPEFLLELRWDAFMLARIVSRHLLCGDAVDVFDNGKGASNCVLGIQIIGVDSWDWDVRVLAVKGLAP